MLTRRVLRLKPEILLKISTEDIEFLKLIRASVNEFLANISTRYGLSSGLLLDIAPQDHLGARPFLPEAISIETLDIDPASNATHILDLTRCARALGRDRYNYVVCTEVLEHTLNPFAAVENIFQILKPAGLVFVSTPFNFRIHGPLPDCWRFTEHGLRELFKDFSILELKSINTPGRDLMPIQYTLVAQKPSTFTARRDQNELMPSSGNY